MGGWYGFFIVFYFIGVQVIYNAGSVSGVKQNDSVIHVHISILFRLALVFLNPLMAGGKIRKLSEKLNTEL